MVDRAASSMSEINTALGLSSGGDTVTVTAGGDFSGNIANYSFGSEVIIRAADAGNRPDFGFTRIQNCDNLAFEDIEFNLNDLFTDGGSICIVQDASTGIRLERCHSSGRSKCFFLNGGSGHTMRDCTVDRVGQGGYTIQACTNTLIESCTTLGMHFMDGASHGDFMQFSGTCDNIAVRDNYCIDVWSFDETKTGATVSSVSGDGTVTVTTGSSHGLSTNERVAILNPDGLRTAGYGWFTVTVLNSTQFTVSTTSAIASNFVGLDVLPDSGSIVQGIFISNGAFTNFTVEGNLIMTNAIGGIHEQPSTITTNSGHTIRNNTVLNNGNGNATQIAWTGVVSKSGNIAEVGADSGLAVQDDTPANSDYYEKLYQTCISGDGRLGGRDHTDFQIVGGSVAVNNGAFSIINELNATSGLSISAASIADSAMGSVAIVDNKVVYTPDADWHGVAYGEYTASNGQNTSSARWAIPVTKTSPIAHDDTFPAIPQGSGAQDLDVLANDEE